MPFSIPFKGICNVKVRSFAFIDRKLAVYGRFLRLWKFSDGTGFFSVAKSFAFAWRKPESFAFTNGESESFAFANRKPKSFAFTNGESEPFAFANGKPKPISFTDGESESLAFAGIASRRRDSNARGARSE